MMRYVLAFCALATGSVAICAPAPMPAAVFAEQPGMSGPELSPNGRLLAVRAAVADKQRLLILDLDRPEQAPRVFGFDVGVIPDLNWAGDGRVLVTLAVPGIFGLPMLRLFAVDVNAGTIRFMDPKSRGLLGGLVLHTDPGGAWALVSSQTSILQTPSVKRIDLATGVATVVEKSRPDVWSWYADDAGTVRAGIAYTGRRWTIWYRASATEPLKALRGRLPKDDSAVDAVRFVSGDRTGVMVTNGPTGRFGVYNFDLATGTLGSAIYEHPRVDVTSIIADPITGKVSGVRYEDDRRRVAWLDPDMKALQERIEKALPDTENVVVGTSRDKNRVLIRSAGASRRELFYLFDRAARQLTPVLQPYDTAIEAPLAPVVAVSYPARDGLTVPAYLTLPRAGARTGLPLIVLPHGGPFERDSWEFDPFVQFLASRGYAVLQPQFRGSTGYGLDYVKRGYGEWGRRMQDDLDDGMDWLVASGKVDAERVCIMGASYGGYAALWGAIRNPERYRCAISYAGVSDLATQMRHSRKSFEAPRYFRQWQDIVRGEGANEASLASLSPVKQAARLSVPVLIAHGEKDTTVPPEQARAMIAALRPARGPVETVFYPEEAHGFAKQTNLEDFLKRIEAFLVKHNPA